jgi:hypothetical protein
MNNDFHSFKKNLPSKMKDNHAKDLFDDIHHGIGMAVKESVERFYQRFTEENFVGSGQGIMGLGHAEGDDVYVKGEISKYAAANASDSNQASNLILKLMRLHGKLHKIRNKR